MGSSGNVPDISVRLSAQGVQDVVNAFGRIRQEGKKTGVETSASLEFINGALGTMAQLLPSIAIGLAVSKVIELGLSAREAAENLGKLSEKTGASIGTLSVLGLVAHDSEIEFESLNNGMVKLAKNQEDASNGSAKQLKAFKDLGISVKDLKAQDPGQLFVTVAQQLDKLPAGAQKAQIAIALFGKAGAELIPMLDALGTDGFEQAMEKAKKLGLYLDGDMVEAARAAQDAIHELEDIANGLGTRFIAGFAPGFTQGVEMIAESLEGRGVDSVEKFGDGLAKAFTRGISVVLAFVDTVKFALQSLDDGLKNVNGQVKAGLQGFKSGGLVGVISGISGYNETSGYDARQDQRRDQWIDSLNQHFSDAMSPPNRKPFPKPRPGGGASGDGTDEAQRNKTAQARSAYLQSLADNELAIQKLRNQNEAAEDKRSYDAGALALDDYYDRREQRVRDESAAEIAILQKKQAAIAAQAAPTSDLQFKKDQDLAKVREQITEVQIKQEGALAAAEDDRTKAKHDAAVRELEDTQKLQRASGDRFGAAQTALEIEIQQYAELLQRQGQSLDQISAATEAYRKQGEAAIAFGRAQEAGSSGINRLGLGIGAIQDQAANGSITNVAAQAQILQLQRQSLPLLQQIGQQMRENAELSGDPRAIEGAEQYDAALRHMQSTLQNVTTAQTYLVNQLTGNGISALTDFFTAGISGSRSFEDALHDLAGSFEQIVAGMISKLLVYYTILKLVGWIAPNSDFSKTLQASGPFGGITGHASGGWTGNVPIDEIAGFVHGQEFVVKAGPAAKYRALLEALNSGKMPAFASTTSMATTKSYVNDLSSSSDGNGSIGGGAQPIVQVINQTGQPSSQRQSTTPDGRSLTQVVIGAVTADIKGGGQVAQAVQSTFGASRQGVRRG